MEMTAETTNLTETLQQPIAQARHIPRGEIETSTRWYPGPWLARSVRGLVADILPSHRTVKQSAGANVEDVRRYVVLLCLTAYAR